MRIETVNIEDVYPVEDKYGNQYLSRDYSLKANQEYVKKLAKSFGPDGQPDEPPVLVEDGGIYRVKSGNSRIMAMRELGTKEFTAVIDERDTPQSLVEATVRTDTKKTYEAVERSRYEQQLYLFGPDEYVSEVTGRSVDDVRKVRRAKQAASDASEDMTIERMIAIGEFADDPEAVEKLTNCPQKEWERVAATLRQKRDHAEREAALMAALEARGIPVVDEAPDHTTIKHINAASAIPNELPDGAVFVRSTYHDGTYNGGWLKAPTTEDISPEQAARDQAKAEHDALYEICETTREQWIISNLEDDNEHLWELVDSSPYVYRVSRFIERAELNIPKGPADTLNAYLDNRGNLYGYHDDPHPDRCKTFIALTDAMEADGYEPPEEEQRLYCMAKEITEGNDDE